LKRNNNSQNRRQKAQLSLGKADRTAYVWNPTSDFQSRREKDFSGVTQFHARYVNGTLLSKAAINASITHVALGDTLSSQQAI